MLKLTLVLLIFYTIPALATKARIQSLGNSFHLIDTQSVFKKPIDLIYLNPLVSFESGVTNATTLIDGAEGFVSYSLNDKTQLGFALGHQDEAIVTSRTFMNAIVGAATYEMSQNPVHFFYAIKDSLTSYSLGGFYSNKEDKLNGLTESSAGASFGLELGNWQFNTIYTLVNSVEAAAGKKFDGKGYSNSSVSYLLDETLFRFSYLISDAKSYTNAVENEFHRIESVTLGLVDSNLKEDNTFFWSAEIISTAVKCKVNTTAYCNEVFTSTSLPFLLGIEARANDWITLRSSIKQIFLVSVIKDELGYPTGSTAGATGARQDVTSTENSTVMTLGMGLNFNKVSIDGTFTTNTTQVFNFNTFLSQVGVTYQF
ncbi:MAG: hypothetical protein ABL930_02665 [Pseudobdellovibrio sp.]